MDIVINIIPLYGKITGVGKYTYYILKNLIENFWVENKFYAYTPTVITELKSTNDIDNLPLREQTTNFIKKLPLLRKFLKYIIEKKSLLSLKTFDIYFEPNFVPLSIKAKKIVATVHDLSFLLFPEWHPEDRVAYISKGFFEKTLYSDLIITPSNYIKEELQSHFPNLENKVFAVHLGVDRNIYNPVKNYSLLKTKNIPEKYILYVGSIEPRKNLKNLLEAYALLPESIKKEFPLLLVGFEGWKNKDIQKLIKQLSKYVKYLGYVEEEVLAELYKNASVFVYPSFYEGFGLPPIEAMACGCPTIVTKVASLPEVCGDAALYIENPKDKEEIAYKIHMVLENNDLRNQLKKLAIKQAGRYDWKKSAEQHLQLFKYALCA